MYSDVPPPVADLVATMASLSTAAPTLVELAEATGLDLEALQDVLTDADAAGLLTIWGDCPDGVAVTLSPLAAELAGLRLAEGPERVGRYLFKWEPADAPVPREFNVPEAWTVTASSLANPEIETGDFLDKFVDPSAVQPSEAVEFEERVRDHLATPREATGKSTRAPGEEIKIKPTILLGLRPQWNSPEEPEGERVHRLRRPTPDAARVLLSMHAIGPRPSPAAGAPPGDPGQGRQAGGRLEEGWRRSDEAGTAGGGAEGAEGGVGDAQIRTKERGAACASPCRSWYFKLSFEEVKSVVFKSEIVNAVIKKPKSNHAILTIVKGDIEDRRIMIRPHNRPPDRFPRLKTLLSLIIQRVCNSYICLIVKRHRKRHVPGVGDLWGRVREMGVVAIVMLVHEEMRTAIQTGTERPPAGLRLMGEC